VEPGGGGLSESGESVKVIERYLMPSDGGYALQLDAVYTLPDQYVGPMDIAPATSLLWMAEPLAAQVRLSQ